METNKQANVCKTGLSLFVNLFNTFVCNMEYYYGQSKNNRKTPTGTENLYYYGRIITLAGITMAGQKCIAEIGGRSAGTKNLYYYGRIITMVDITMAGLHCTLKIILTPSQPCSKCAVPYVIASKSGFRKQPRGSLSISIKLGKKLIACRRSSLFDFENFIFWSRCSFIIFSKNIAWCLKCIKGEGGRG